MLTWTNLSHANRGFCNLSYPFSRLIFMKHRAIFFISALMLACSLSAADTSTSYSSWSRKANRFFDNEEWASASAMYTLMLSERPDSVAVWGNAIVAAGMQNLPDRQIELFNGALKAALPLDSVFNAIQSSSFSIMQTDLYERFLINIREHEPWMERVINRRLLDYYTFRDNGPGMVELSTIMLAGLPGDERFLYTLAKGQLLCDDIDSAIKTYNEIAKLYPQSLKALLYLGNYYAAIPSHNAEAISFLSRAQQIQPAPYLQQKLASLQHKH